MTELVSEPSFLLAALGFHHILPVSLGAVVGFLVEAAAMGWHLFVSVASY